VKADVVVFVLASRGAPNDTGREEVLRVDEVDSDSGPGLLVMVVELLGLDGLSPRRSRSRDFVFWRMGCLAMMAVGRARPRWDQDLLVIGKICGRVISECEIAGRSKRVIKMLGMGAKWDRVDSFDSLRYR
jgi:hypothetical protein